MSVLLLRLSGPMQSWGLNSHFTERDTAREPTKSGVIGLLCAALGKPRQERAGDGFPALADLAAPRMGVRVDKEATVRRDFHTAGGGKWLDGDYGVAKASGAKGETVISNRHYLADAVFLVGLEGDGVLLATLDHALAHPVWPLFLGRKSFVPGEPIWLKDGLLAAKSLEESLRSFPCLLAGRALAKEPPPVRFVMECRAGEEGETRQDVPLSFQLGARSHGVRRVRECLKPWADVLKEAAPCT